MQANNGRIHDDQMSPAIWRDVKEEEKWTPTRVEKPFPYKRGTMTKRYQDDLQAMDSHGDLVFWDREL